MPGPVPSDDLPDELSGPRVPIYDLPDEAAAPLHAEFESARQARGPGEPRRGAIRRRPDTTNLTSSQALIDERGLLRRPESMWDMPELEYTGRVIGEKLPSAARGTVTGIKSLPGTTQQMISGLNRLRGEAAANAITDTILQIEEDLKAQGVDMNTPEWKAYFQELYDQRERERESARASGVKGAEAGERVAALQNPKADATERAFAQGIPSAVQSTAVGLPTALLTRSPAATGAAVGTVLGTGAMGARYNELRESGVPHEPAVRSAALMGSLEALTEGLPGGSLVKANRPFLKRALDFMVQDLFGENVTTTAQMLDDYRLGLREDVTLEDWLNAVQETTAATLVSVGAQTTAQGLLEKSLELANRRAAAKDELLAGPQVQIPEVPAPVIQPNLGAGRPTAAQPSNLTSERGFGPQPPTETQFPPQQEGGFQNQTDSAMGNRGQNVPAEDLPDDLAEAQHTAGAGYTNLGAGMADTAAPGAENTEFGGAAAPAEAQQDEGYMDALAASEPPVRADTGKTQDFEVAGQPVRVNTAPSQAQKDAGNYQKGHIRFQGLDIAIENPKGTERQFTKPDGKRGRRTMEDDYGYVKRTEGADGDAVDVFIGPNLEATNAYVIDQLTPDGSAFDEHKVILGANSEEEAANLYLRNYQKGWKGLGAITPITMDRFKTWVAKGVRKEPIAWVPQAKRDPRRADAENDSLLEFIAKTKLHGNEGFGLSIEAMEAEGLDPADMKAMRGLGITRPFTRKGSKSLDHMAEVLSQYGYPVTDEAGNYSANKLLELISQEISGNKVYSTHRQQGFTPDQQRDMQLEEFMQTYEPPQDLFGVPDATLDDYIEKLQMIERQRQATSDEPFFNRGKATQQDLFGDAVAMKNELQRLMAEKDRRRNSGQESPDIGRSDDLFSQANRQVDIADQMKQPDEKPAAGDVPPELAEARDAAARRHGFDPGEVGWQEGKGPLGRGKFMAGARGEQSNLKATPDEAMEELASFVGASTRAKQAEQDREKALTTLATKIKAGEKPEFKDWKRAFPHLKEGHRYLRQPEVSPFLVKHFGFSPARIKAGLGKAAGNLTTDGGTKYPIVYFDRLHEVLGPKKQEVSKTDAALSDAGEKIGGARKDRWAERGMNLSDLEEMTDAEAAKLVTKGAVWKPDYEAMIEGGMPKALAGGIKLLWDSLAAKPRENTPQGRIYYVDGLRKLREVLLAHKEPKDISQTDRLFMEAINYPERRGYEEPGYKTYWAIQKARRTTLYWGFDENNRLRKLLEAGFPNTEAWSRLFKIARGYGAGLTDHGINVYLQRASAAGTPLEADRMKAEGFYEVMKKNGAVVGYAHTKEGAESLAKDLYAAEISGRKSGDVTPERPHLDKVKRTGPQVRSRDAESQDFITDFGFRGIEFGNWAANDERQKLMNLAYDALWDLSSILNIPPEALSLDGTMGLALAARGGGRFAAHYESGKLVINLTKLRGAGALAHEWGHALDHYFGELDRKDAYKTDARGASGWHRMPKLSTNENLRPEMRKAFKDLMGAIFERNRTRAEAIRELELSLETKRSDVQRFENAIARTKASAQPNLEYIKSLEGAIAGRKDIIAAGEKQLARMQASTEEGVYGKTETTYAKEATKLSGKSGDTGYWRRPTEMFARAFEAYVFDRLAGKQLTSEYLVQGVEAERFASGYKGNPYPTGMERQTINEAFDRLFATIKTRQGEKSVALYHREKPLMAAEFSERIRETFGIEFRMHEASNLENTLRLDTIIVPKDQRSRGVGSEVMRMVTEYADSRGMRVILQTGERDDVHGTTSSARLKRFYKRFGFFENRGRRRDFTYRDNMVRPARVLERQSIELKDRATFTIEAPKPSSKAPPNPQQFDIFAAANNPAPAKEASKYLIKTHLVNAGEFRSGLEKVKSSHDAAHIFAPLRKYPQEQFLALALDADDRPIAILRHSMGHATASVVDPVAVAGALASMPGIKSVWFGHNHPSSTLMSSTADNLITEKLTQIISPMGIEVRGHIIVGTGQKRAFSFGYMESGYTIDIKAARRSGKVDIVERRMQRLHPSYHNRPFITDPSQAMAYVKSLNGQTGLIMMDAMRGVIGFFPMSDAEMLKLKTGNVKTGSAAILRAMHESNAQGFITVSETMEAAKNVLAFASRSGAVMADGFYRNYGGELVSGAQMGTMHSPPWNYNHRARDAELLAGPVSVSELTGGVDPMKMSQWGAESAWTLIQYYNYANQKGQTAHIGNRVYVPVDSLRGLKETRSNPAPDLGTVSELANAMRTNGYDVRYPILITVNGKGEASIFDGNHRARGADQAGLKEVPVLVTYLDGGEKVDGPFSPEKLGQVALASATKLTTPVTETKEFKRWFGDSKVVDANGKPLVVYHGNRQKPDDEPITVFHNGRRATDEGWMGRGFYFGQPRTANVYAGHHAFEPDHFPQGGTVYPVYLSLKNPAMLIDSERNDGPRTMARELVDLPDSASAEEVTNALIAAGYDGVIYERRGTGWSVGSDAYREYVAFRPDQIKSATGNRGTFDPSDPNILRNVTSFNPFVSRQTQVNDAVQRSLKGFANKPPVTVVPTFDALPRGAYERIGGVLAKVSGTTAFVDFSPAGMHVYLIADRLRSDQHVAEVVAHEMTHYGLEEFTTPEEWDAISQGVLRDQKARVAAIVKQEEQSGRKIDMTNPRHQAIVVHEVLAYMNQKRRVGKPFDAVEESLWQRVMRAIRAVLARMGLTGPAYTDEYVASLLDAMTAKMRSPRVQAAKGEIPGFVNLNPLRNQEAPLFYSAVLRAVEGMKMASAPAQQWWNTLKNRPGIKPEELAWLGLEDWLKAQEGQVTKDQVAEFVRANQIQVLDVTKGGGAFSGYQALVDQRLVELTALGYDARIDYDTDIEQINRLSDGAPFFFDRVDGLVDEDGRPADVPEEVTRAVTELDRAVHAAIIAAEDGDDADGTRYGQYTLPGGENYREILLTLPARDTITTEPVDSPRGWGDTNGGNIGIVRRGDTGADYRSSHWYNIPNVLAHIRLKDRLDKDGRKVLFVEEIQSDWHQAGRKRGYRGHIDTSGWTAKKQGNTEWTVYDAKENIIQSIPLTNQNEEKLTSAEDAIRWALETVNDKAIPDAPFKTTWAELAFKRVLRMAAEGGYDSIAWTTGDQQNKRYGLEKHISKVTLSDNNSGSGIIKAQMEGPFEKGLLTVYDKKGISIIGPKWVDREEISEIIGEELADKLTALPGESVLNPGGGVRMRRLEGLDLRVGGEGMRGFYDTILPATANRLVKKWGGKVGSLRLQRTTGPEMPPKSEIKRAIHDYIDGGIDLDELSNQVGADVEQKDMEFLQGIDPYRKEELRREVSNFADVLIQRGKGQAGSKQHALPITDAMRQAALQGLPLFNREEMADQQEAILEGHVSLEEDTWRSRTWNWLVFRAQDKFNDVLRLQKEAAKYREDMAIPEALDTYMRETLYHGRTEHRFDQYDKEFVQPLLKLVKGSGYTYDQVEQFLYARHAPEANAHIRKITQGHPELFAENQAEWHSGMTDEQAAAKMEEPRGAGDIARLEAIGAHVDRMTKFRRDILVSEGLESAATVGNWEATYQHYVPLRGWADKPEKGRHPGRGKGFDTGRKNDRRRTGRKTLAGNVLATLVGQAQATIILAEKAKVGRAFLEFAKTHPSDLYTVNQVEMERYFDEGSGLVKERPVFRGKQPDHLMKVMVDGKPQWIEFNENDPQAMRMATAFKNLSAKEMNGVFTFLLGVNRVLAMLNTSLNPEFVISNLFRDIQTAMINLNATQAKELKARIFTDWRKAFGGIMSGEFGRGESEWAQYFQEFKAAGAKTGWIDFTQSPADLEQKLRAELDETTIGQMFRGGMVQGVNGAGVKVWRKGIKPVLEVVDRVNLAVENAIRLSVFVNARRQGLSEDKSAELAKNLTINFNRKGDWGTELNAMYLFYNAAAQGTAVLWNVMKNKNARRVLYGIAAFAMAMQILNRFAAGEDDDGENLYDKIPEYERAKNLIIMLPKGMRFTLESGDVVSYLKIPLPYGYNMVYQTGAAAGDILDHNFIGNKRELDVGGMSGRWISEFIGAFNPVGANESLIQTVAPTILDPAIALYENQNWYGGNIYPESSPFDVAPPGSEQYYRNASDLSRLVAQTLNELTGGSDVTPGLISIPPNAIDYTAEQVTGGLGRFIENTGRTAANLVVSPEKIEVGQVPFVRRLVGQIGDRYTSDTYYARQDRVRYLEKEMQALRELEPGTAARRKKQAYIDANFKVESSMFNAYKQSDGKVSGLRRALKAEKAKTDIQQSKKDARIKELEQQIQEEMESFNTRWNEVEDSSRQSTSTRDIIGELRPMMQGKTKPAYVAALREAGYPSMARLIDSMPFRPRAAMASVYDKERGV